MDSSISLGAQDLDLENFALILPIFACVILKK